MLFVNFLFVLVLALILSGILAYGLGWRHPAKSADVGTAALFLFAILMFAMWAGGAWLPPWGPLLYGTPWLTILLVGFMVSLLVLAIATPVRRSQPKREAAEPTEETAVVGSVFGLFFWLLMLVLLIAMLVRYIV